MYKKSLFAAFIAVVTFNCYAQKLEGSLEFLKGQEKLHVVLNFDDAQLQGKSEKAYLETVDEQWANGWEAAKSSPFMEKLLEHLNKNVSTKKFTLLCGDYPDAQYQATVRVLTVKRDFVGPYLEGPGTRIVTCEVVFTKTGDSTPLAKITKISGTSQAKVSGFAPVKVGAVVGTVGAVGSNTHLTGIAFGYVGESIGEFMAKKLK